MKRCLILSVIATACITLRAGTWEWDFVNTNGINFAGYLYNSIDRRTSLYIRAQDYAWMYEIKARVKSYQMYPDFDDYTVNLGVPKADDTFDITVFLSDEYDSTGAYDEDLGSDATEWERYSYLFGVDKWITVNSQGDYPTSQSRDWVAGAQPVWSYIKDDTGERLVDAPNRSAISKTFDLLAQWKRVKNLPQDIIDGKPFANMPYNYNYMLPLWQTFDADGPIMVMAEPIDNTNDVGVALFVEGVEVEDWYDEPSRSNFSKIAYVGNHWHDFNVGNLIYYEDNEFYPITGHIFKHYTEPSSIRLIPCNVDATHIIKIGGYLVCSVRKIVSNGSEVKENRRYFLLPFITSVESDFQLLYAFDNVMEVMNEVPRPTISGSDIKYFDGVNLYSLGACYFVTDYSCDVDF